MKVGVRSYEKSEPERRGKEKDMSEEICCLLGRDKPCGDTRCDQCGWNAEVAAERENALHTYGLEKGPDGLYRCPPTFRERADRIKNGDGHAGQG